MINISFFNTSSWCADPTSDLTSQHLQVDLMTFHYVSAVSTQGSVTQNSWVSSYHVHYSLDGDEWIVLTDKKGEIKVCFSTARIFKGCTRGRFKMMMDWVASDHPFIKQNQEP